MNIIGIDEVGRGAWAGPLLVVATRQIKDLPEGLKDSKKLSKRQREVLFDEIINSCQIGEGWVEPVEIDELGLTKAMQLGVSRALGQIKAKQTDEIIMDGTINYCSNKFTAVKCIARADDLYPIVSAASVYAKVTRDLKMVSLAEEYSDYGFAAHVGYGTKKHEQALKQHGVCVLHRLSYRPVKAFL